MGSDTIEQKLQQLFVQGFQALETGWKILASASTDRFCRALRPCLVQVRTTASQRCPDCRAAAHDALWGFPGVAPGGLRSGVPIGIGIGKPLHTIRGLPSPTTQHFDLYTASAYREGTLPCGSCPLQSKQFVPCHRRQGSVNKGVAPAASSLAFIR